MIDGKEYSPQPQSQPLKTHPNHHHCRVYDAKNSDDRRSSPVPSILSSKGSTANIPYRPPSLLQQQQQPEQPPQPSPTPSSSFSTRLLKLRSSRTEPFKRRLPKFDLLSLNDLSSRRRRPSEPILNNASSPPLPRLPSTPSSQSLLTKALPSLPVQSWSTLGSLVTPILVDDDDAVDGPWQTVKQVCARVRQCCASEDLMSWLQLAMLLETLERVGANASAASGGVLSANKDTLDKLKAHCEQEDQMTQVILGIDALAESWLIEYELTQCPLLLNTTISSNEFCTEVPQFIIRQQHQHKKDEELRTLPDYPSIWPEHLDTTTSWFRNYFIGKPYVTFVRLNKPTTIISVVHQQDEAVYRIIIRTRGMGTRYHCVREDQMMNGVNAHRHAVAIACSSRLNLREFKEFSPESTILSGIEKELLRFDEMPVPKHYKFGVIHVQNGQDAEELWFANSGLTEGLERLLDLVGNRVELKGYMGYAGGLDTRAGESGEVSYVSKWRSHEIMFHVGPLMPQREHDQQQVHRKRYIGNDIVCLVFVDKHTKFDPSKIRSKFLHVFIVVQQLDDGEHWRVEVVRSTSVQAFGPTVPSPTQLSSNELRDYLLLKMVNAENAALKSDKFAIPNDKARDCLLTNMATVIFKHDVPSPPSIPATSPSKSERPSSSVGNLASSSWRPSLDSIPIPPIPTPTRSTILRDIKDGLVRRRRRSDGIKSSTTTSQSQQQQKLSTGPETSTPPSASKRSNSFTSRLGRRAGIKRTDTTL